MCSSWGDGFCQGTQPAWPDVLGQGTRQGERAKIPPAAGTVSYLALFISSAVSAAAAWLLPRFADREPRHTARKVKLENPTTAIG